MWAAVVLRRTVWFCIKGIVRQLKEELEENTITVVFVSRSLTGEGLVSKNIHKCINASPFSPGVWG